MLGRLVTFIATRSLFTKLISVSASIFILTIVLLFLIATGYVTGSLSDLFFKGGNVVNVGYVGAVAVFMLCIVFSFILGAIYFFIGISRLMYEKIKRIPKPQMWKTKEMIGKGLITALVSFVVYFLLSLALSFFGLTLGSNCLCLPKIPPPDYKNSDTGFPVADIKVVGLTQAPIPSANPHSHLSPNPSGDMNGLTCILTLENTSNTFTATNVSLAYYDKGQPDGEKKIRVNHFTGTEHILPGQTYQVQLQVLQKDCNSINSVKIVSAGIAKNP